MVVSEERVSGFVGSQYSNRVIFISTPCRIVLRGYQNGESPIYPRITGSAEQNPIELGVSFGKIIDSDNTIPYCALSFFNPILNSLCHAESESAAVRYRLSLI